jgi:endopolyphosphatase
LHVTDFHPDPHYVAGATFETGCHRKPNKKGKGKDLEELDEDEGLKGKKKEDLSGKWGSAVSYVLYLSPGSHSREPQLIDRDCDSPMSLVNMTFDWIKKEWADEVDFVIWTGDNARQVQLSAPLAQADI